MREGRQRYYAALDHENAVQRLFDGYDGGTKEGSAQREAGALGGETGTVETAEGLYNELGVRVYRAFENFLGNLSEMGKGGWNSNQARRVLNDCLQPLSCDLEEIRRRLEHHESLLNELAAGIRRIDRFTLEAFQRMSGRFSAGAPDAGGALSVAASSVVAVPQRGEVRAYEPPRRLSKEETIARSLEAARRLRSQGRKLTLKSVADAAGLKYSQIVYAFGSKDEMLQRVQRDSADVPSAS